MVMFAGHVMAGAALSSTTIIWTHVLEFPQASVAVHVRVMVLSCGQAPPTVTSAKVIKGVGSQLSVAVAEPVAGGNVLAVQETVRLAGHVIIGGSSSWTNICCRQVLEFPQWSVAVHVLFIV
jgi:hypothetical protein